MQYKIYIFYNKYSISEEIAINTKEELKKNNLNIELVEDTDIFNYILKLQVEEDITNIYYIWDTPSNIDYDVVDRWNVTDISPNSYCFYYGEKHKDNYLLAKEILNVLEELKICKEVYYIDKCNLRIFHTVENKYETEKTLYFQKNYRVENSFEKCKEVLKIIIEERYDCLNKEIELLNKNYDNSMIAIKNELKKINYAKKFL